MSKGIICDFYSKWVGFRVDQIKQRSKKLYIKSSKSDNNDGQSENMSSDSALNSKKQSLKQVALEGCKQHSQHRQYLHKQYQAMPHLCPSTYIPSNISHSQSEIQLHFENTSEELLKVYRDKMPFDMMLRFNQKQHQVHVYVIEQHSDIFWKGLVKKQPFFYAFDITLHFNYHSIEHLFQKLIHALYGQKVNIYRSEVLPMYKICKELHLTELLDMFHTDMLINSDQYEFFPLMQLANQQKIIDIFSMSYEHLEVQHFQQMRYSKSGLLLCEPDLFKNILKKHNLLKFKNGSNCYGLGSCEIKILIEEYCSVNGIKGRRKQRFFQQIQNKNPLTNSIASQSKIYFSPAKKNYTCTKMVSMTSLKDINQPEEEENRNYGNRNKNKLSKCVSFADNNPSRSSLKLKSIENLSPLHLRGIKANINRISDDSEEQQSSASQCSLSAGQNLSKQRNKLQTSLNLLISDPETVSTINKLSSSLHTSLKSSTETQKKAYNLVNSMKVSLTKSRRRMSRMELMESELQEIRAEMETGKERLREVEKVVKEIERRQKQKKEQEKRIRRRMMETSIELNLTISREFGTRCMKRPC